MDAIYLKIPANKAVCYVNLENVYNVKLGIQILKDCVLKFIMIVYKLKVSNVMMLILFLLMDAVIVNMTVRCFVQVVLKVNVYNVKKDMDSLIGIIINVYPYVVIS